MQDEQLQEILVIAQRKHPGRTWNDLTEAEQDAVYADHKGRKSTAMDMLNAPMPQGQRVGPSGIYVENPWNAIGAATQRITGGYLLGKANAAEKEGRKALAELQTRRDSLDRENANRQSAEDERYRQQMLRSILSR